MLKSTNIVACHVSPSGTVSARGLIGGPRADMIYADL